MMKIFIAVIVTVIATTALAEPPVQAPYAASGWKPDGPAFELPPREPSKFRANLEQDSYLPPAKEDQDQSSTPSSEYGVPTGALGLPSAEPLSPFISATQKTPVDSFSADLKLLQQQLEKQQVQEFNTLNKGQKPQQNNNFANEPAFNSQSQNLQKQNAIFIKLNDIDPNPNANLAAAKPLKLIQPQQTFGQQYLAPNFDIQTSQLAEFRQLNNEPVFALPQQTFNFAPTQDFVSQNPSSFAQFSQFEQINTSPSFISQKQQSNGKQSTNEQQNINQQFKAQQPHLNDQNIEQNFVPQDRNSFRQLAVQYQTSNNGQYNQANPVDSQQSFVPQLGQLNIFDGSENAITQFSQLKAPLPQQFKNTNNQGKIPSEASQFVQQSPPPNQAALFGKSNGLETEQNNQFKTNNPVNNQNNNAQFRQASTFQQLVAPQFGQLNDNQQIPQLDQFGGLNGYTQQQQLYSSPQVFAAQATPQEFGQIQTFVPSPTFGQSFGNQQVVPQADLIAERGNLQTFGQLQSPNLYQSNNENSPDGSETDADDSLSSTQFAFGARNSPFERTKPGASFPTYGPPIQSYGPPENKNPITDPKSTFDTMQENADDPSTEENNFDGPNIAISTAVADGRRRRGSARLRKLRRNRPLFTLDKMGRLIRLH